MFRFLKYGLYAFFGWLPDRELESTMEETTLIWFSKRCMDSGFGTVQPIVYDLYIGNAFNGLPTNNAFNRGGEEGELQVQLG